MPVCAKVMKYVKILMILNVIVLTIRLFGEVRIYSIDALFNFGIDYYIFSGTIASFAIVIILPKISCAAKNSLLTILHSKWIIALIMLNIISLIWAIAYSITASDPLGVFLVYIWNYYIVEFVNIIYLFRMRAVVLDLQK